MINAWFQLEIFELKVRNKILESFGGKIGLSEVNLGGAQRTIFEIPYSSGVLPKRNGSGTFAPGLHWAGKQIGFN